MGANTKRHSASRVAEIPDNDGRGRPSDSIPKKMGQNFAKKDGRTASHFRPLCLDPLKVEGEVIVAAQEETEALAQHFVTYYGAPDVSAAMPVAKDEIEHMIDLSIADEGESIVYISEP